ncbi:hypothetical protein CRM22_003955 [Opisthorchis felineus]|uniref:Uncharacterized protein n=1 Tax=Opisthorchis felineus TaxID=147828 RepID=A0A4S2M4W5_OPIFE|nr:hypothetical protein CRM22_003955 [Opisthorchis felineus]
MIIHGYDVKAEFQDSQYSSRHIPKTNIPELLSPRTFAPQDLDIGHDVGVKLQLFARSWRHSSLITHNSVDFVVDPIRHIFVYLSLCVGYLSPVWKTSIFKPVFKGRG